MNYFVYFSGRCPYCDHQCADEQSFDAHVTMCSEDIPDFPYPEDEE